MLEGLDSGETRFLLLVGADPVRDVPDPRQAVLALDSAEYVVSIDLFLNDSNREADVVLPAAGFAEKEGTVTNLEGRVQKVNVIAPIPGQGHPDWAILDDLAERAGRPIGLSTAESIAKEISEVAPAYSGITWDHLEWDARDGAVVPLSGSQALTHIPVALKGDTAPSAPLLLHVARTLYDDGVMMRHTPMLHPLAPGPVAHLNPEDAKRAGAQDGHAVKVVTSHGEGEFDVVVDEGTPEGVVYVPFNQPGAEPLGTDAVVRVTAVGR
jgi:predicted molibdopterin-dependent oxidoreductase YjgC